MYATVPLTTSGDISISTQLNEELTLIESDVRLLKQALIGEVAEFEIRANKERKARRCFKFSKAPKIRRKCARG